MIDYTRNVFYSRELKKQQEEEEGSQMKISGAPTKKNN
jgi:hypothetical protein